MSAVTTTPTGIKTPGNYINEVMTLVKAKNPAPTIQRNAAV